VSVPFNLPAYLERIRLPARPTLDHLGLMAVQRAHRLAIPFENLDIALGRGIDISPDAVFGKLVIAGRGGYCFEQNRLFLDALRALGFEARPLLARVWLNGGGVPPKTHTLNLVTVDGQEWIADAGFGGSYAPPMPLAEEAEAEAPDGARYRLTRDAAHGWLLAREGSAGTTDGRGGGEGLQPQYSFTTEEVWPADLALANHWTATAPNTRFTTLNVVSIVLPHGFASLTDRSYRRRAGEEETAAEIDDPRVYRMRLGMMFGIALTKEEVAALGLF
jgi:N-hydroxyarylamine O-acetyltransferase